MTGVRRNPFHFKDRLPRRFSSAKHGRDETPPVHSVELAEGAGSSPAIDQPETPFEADLWHFPELYRRITGNRW